MLSDLRPALKPGTRTRRRDDGSAAAWNPDLGRGVELGADEAPLIELIDGQRSLADIADAHARVHGFVPFTALRDLLRILAREGLLATPEADLQKHGLLDRRTTRQAMADLQLAELPLPAGKVVTVAGFAALLGAAVFSLGRPVGDVSGWDVLLAYFGAALALTGRSFGKAAVTSLHGEVPNHVELNASWGVLHLEPDHAGLALLDRRPRAMAHLAGLLGGFATYLAVGASPGLAAGALGAFIADLIPFEPTSAGKLFAVMAGKVDLREHVRAYLSRRLLARATSTQLFDGELSLVASLVASLAWFTLVIQVLFRKGVVAVLQLVKVAIDADLGGVERGLALSGAAVVTLCMPAALFGLGWALLRAASSLRPRKGSAAGVATGASLGSVDLAQIPVFGQLDGTHLGTLARAVKELRFSPGQRIVVQGEPGDRFFAIRSGRVLVTHQLPSGVRREVARLGPGDCFGETALLEAVPRTATVLALSEVVVAALSRADFDGVRKSMADVDLTHLLRAAAALHKSRYFGKLPQDRLSALALKLRPRTLAKGTEVVRAGDAGDEFFLIATGSMEVLDGNGGRVGELRAGDHFGEIALLRDVPRVATVRAVEDALVLVLAKSDFIAAMSADLTLSAQLEELAADRAEARA